MMYIIRTMEYRPQAASDAAVAAAWPAVPEPQLPQSLRERLDRRPQLSAVQVCS